MREGTFDLPREAADPAELLGELGEPLAELRVDGRRVLLRLLGALATGMFGTVLLVVLLYVAMQRRPGGGIIKLLFLAAALDVASVVMTVRTWRNRGLYVRVYPEGLVQVRGDRVDAIFWDEVESFSVKKRSGFWNFVTHGAASQDLTLRRQVGTELTLNDSLPDLKRLAGLIEARLLEGMLPDARRRFEGGERLGFGGLALGRDGLHHGKKCLEWADVSKVEFTDAAVTISRRGKWLAWVQVNYAELSNAFLLRVLVREAALRGPIFEVKE